MTKRQKYELKCVLIVLSLFAATAAVSSGYELHKPGLSVIGICWSALVAVVNVIGR